MGINLKPRLGGGPYQGIGSKYVICFDLSFETENSNKVSSLEQIASLGISLNQNRSFEVKIGNRIYQSRWDMDPTEQVVEVFVDDRDRSILAYQESQNGATTLNQDPVSESRLVDEIISNIQVATQKEINFLEDALTETQSRL